VRGVGGHKAMCKSVGMREVTLLFARPELVRVTTKDSMGRLCYDVWLDAGTTAE
jgi:hypothetical protein